MPLAEIEEKGAFVDTRGVRTRKEVDNEVFIRGIRHIAENLPIVAHRLHGKRLACENGLLLAERKATTNKMAFDWVVEQDKSVSWVRKARWVNDNKYYTSSGVSAGIDMALGFVRDRHGMEAAERIARGRSTSGTRTLNTTHSADARKSEGR